MYKITSGANTYYSDTLVPVRLAANGCYVPCTETEATGFCAKIPMEYTQEDSTKITVPTDTVFRTKEMGDEPEGATEEFAAAVIVTESADMKSALESLGYKVS